MSSSTRFPTHLLLFHLFSIKNSSIRNVPIELQHGKDTPKATRKPVNLNQVTSSFYNLKYHQKEKYDREQQEIKDQAQRDRDRREHAIDEAVEQIEPDI